MKTISNRAPRRDDPNSGTRRSSSLPLLLVALMGLMTSCVTRPIVQTETPDGIKTTVWLGGVAAAEADNVLASVETPQGVKVKYSAKREDGTKVPIEGFRAWLAKWLAFIQGDVSKARIASEERVAIGAQGVQMHGQTQETIKATFVPPTQ